MHASTTFVPPCTRLEALNKLRGPGPFFHRFGKADDHAFQNKLTNNKTHRRLQIIRERVVEAFWVPTRIKSSDDVGFVVASMDGSAGANMDLGSSCNIADVSPKMGNYCGLQKLVLDNWGLSRISFVSLLVLSCTGVMTVSDVEQHGRGYNGCGREEDLIVILYF